MLNKQVHISSPDAFLMVYSYPNQNTSEAEAMLVYDDILSIQTSKNKESPGSWDVTLAPQKEYNKIIHPGDWVTIHISDEKLDPEKDKTKSIKLIGIVKTVRRIESTNPENGLVFTRFTIAGQDFASCLNIPLYINNQLAGTDTSSETAFVSLFHGIGKDVKDRVVAPQRLAEKILNFIFNGGPNKSTSTLGYQFNVPPQLIKDVRGSVVGSGFLSFIKKDFQKNLVGIADVQPDIGGVVTALSLLQIYSNQILNEFYAEIFPNDDGSVSPTLVLRSIPFNKNKGAPFSQCLSIKDANQNDLIPKKNDNKLYLSKNISDSEILNLNFGKSEAERFNFFLAVPNMVGSSIKKSLVVSLIQESGGLQNMADLESIKKYGVRPYITSSIFTISENDGGLVKFNETVRDMWNKAYAYDSGLVELIGSAQHIPVGTNIKFMDRSWIAHVESVNNSYMVNPYTGIKTFKTNIAFVRLQTLDGKPL